MEIPKKEGSPRRLQVPPRRGGGVSERTAALETARGDPSFFETATLAPGLDSRSLGPDGHPHSRSLFSWGGGALVGLRAAELEACQVVELHQRMRQLSCGGDAGSSAF